MLHFYNFAPKKEGGNVKLSQLTKTKALVRKTFPEYRNTWFFTRKSRRNFGKNFYVRNY